MEISNPILKTDSYKFSHFLQYPPGTSEVSAYIEARPGGRYPEITFFGLQMFLRSLSPASEYAIDEAEAIVTAHGLPFNRAGWRIIVDEYGGRLPLEIQAIPEGMTVPVGTPLVQLRNTDPRLPWLTTFVETALLRAVWYPSTVATVSREVKKTIYAGLLRSSDDPDGQINFKLHDFGARGCTSGEQAGIGGVAHLVSFMGTDTVEALVYARRYYNADMPGFSIPAAEHSTITAWERKGEADAYANMLEQFGGAGKLVAVVSDSYDLDNAVSRLWGEQLRAKVIATGGTLVIRPDSGDPVETPVNVIRELDRIFGSSLNSKGYQVLNSAVRVIQGDGMSPDTIAALVREVMAAGYAIDNIAFGMGGGLLQKLDRDTMRFAMKANEIVVDGQRRAISKAPAGDPGKASKAGRLAVLHHDDGSCVTVPEASAPVGPNLLRPVWRNGELLREYSFDEVRNNAAIAAPAVSVAA